MPPGRWLRVETGRGTTVEGEVIDTEKVRQGVLVTIRTANGDRTFVLPSLDAPVPLPFPEASAAEGAA